MPKVTRRSRKESRSSPVVVSAERPRRSTRVKSTCGKTENISGTSNTRSNRTNRARPKRKGQPLYTRSVSQANSDPNRRLPLFQLPTELLKQITSTYLPLESALSLTLTCKEAASTIGTWSWASFKQEKRWSPVRTNFFSTLSRDWQSANAINIELEFCARCNTLHPALKPPGQHRKTALTTYCFGQDACIDYLPKSCAHEENGSTLSTQNNTDRGYSLVLPHILSALSSSSSHSQKGSQPGPLIPLLSAAFSTTSSTSNINLHMTSSGRRIDGNLVIRHEYLFHKPGLGAKDMLDLKLYLCPHQCSTRTAPAQKSRYISSEGRNSPLFTHAVNTAFPTHRQARIPADVFRKPTASERRNMEEAHGKVAPVWSCRSCSTKYRVEVVEGKAEARIVVWRCFGRDAVQARKYWRFFVRREGVMLGRDKRNDEWWSQAGPGVMEFEAGE